MSGFLYYVPGREKLTLEGVSGLGLGHAFEGPPNNRSVMANGPDGGRGCVAVDRSFEGAPRIDMSAQTWRPAPKGDAESPPYWIGVVRDDLPTPEDLARDRQLDGRVIEFDAGHRWHVPRLREWRVNDEWPSWDSRVPRRADLDDEGKWVYGEVLRRYRELWDWSCRVAGLMAAEMHSAGRVTIADDAETCDFAAACLGVNYRVDRLEMAVMGMSPTVDAAPVVQYALDVDGLRDHLGNHLRRLAAETTDSVSGVERPTTDAATSTPTGQPSAN